MKRKKKKNEAVLNFLLSANSQKRERATAQQNGKFLSSLPVDSIPLSVPDLRELHAGQPHKADLNIICMHQQGTDYPVCKTA